MSDLKDKIYTIPVTDAFREDSECPFCVLEKNLEDESVNYFLGAALMDPDCRKEMNTHGFCKLHLGALFDSKTNALGLGLILSTYLDNFNENMNKVLDKTKASIQMDGKKTFFSRKSNEKPTQELIDFLIKNRADCTICKKLDNTMKRYISVFFHMWKTEVDFRNIFESKKGFCNKHFLELIEYAGTSGSSGSCLNARENSKFLLTLYEQQSNNLFRIENEIKWFTEKFDYKNNDEPWKNSKDAVQRCIQKLKC